MPSLVPGFEYDIFISYRHNDNRSGWVTDFVNALQEELAATIKEPLSIYFDKNPHDGLLETHNVDKSLEGKLKCLIFIPIISQTYCDPKSFAWQHEFCAFNTLAKEDQLARDVRLSSGNVASRILPIKIHDLDAVDKTMIESEIGGVLRAIEFIYKSAGVNRPLNPSDKKEDNAGKTLYRDQINKTAQAVKALISAIKNPPKQPVYAETPTGRPTIASVRNRKLIFITIGLLLTVAASYFIYKQPSTSKQPSRLDKSIAVLPFVDLSESKDQGWFADGLTEEILNSLAHVKGLNVISRTSSFAFKNKNLRIQTIADSLQVNYIVEGSVRKGGTGLRITAQLIRAQDGFHIWSTTYDRDSNDIFAIQQEIASKIAESLDISLDPQALKKMNWAGTDDPEAFLAFLKARALDDDAHEGGRFIDLKKLKEANVLYEQSMRLDPDFVNPYLFHADFFLHYVLKDDASYQDTLTDIESQELFMNDLANAITHSKEKSQGDYYRIPQTMYSNDWSNFRAVIEKSLNSPDAPKHFKYQNFDLSTILIIMGYGDQAQKIGEEILAQDPTYIPGKRDVLFNLLYKGEYNNFIREVELIEFSPTRFGMRDYKLFALIQLGRVDEVLDFITQNPSEDFSYYDLKAIVLARKGKLEEAKKVLKEPHRHSAFYLLAVDAVFGRQEANKAASLMDQKILLDFPLFRSLFLSPENPPYDLAAAPNFARKLKQAGIKL
jgi:TolB-like protein